MGAGPVGLPPWKLGDESRRHEKTDSICVPSDHTLVDSEYLLPIPEDVDPAEAAPILCAGTFYREFTSSGQSLTTIQERPSTVL